MPVFNTGQTGNGFIDLYSVRGVEPGSTGGADHRRQRADRGTATAWREHWAIGNLKGVYGNTVDRRSARRSGTPPSTTSRSIRPTAFGCSAAAGAAGVHYGHWDMAGNRAAGLWPAAADSSSTPSTGTLRCSPAASTRSSCAATGTGDMSAGLDGRHQCRRNGRPTSGRSTRSSGTTGAASCSSTARTATTTAVALIGRTTPLPRACSWTAPRCVLMSDGADHRRKRHHDAATGRRRRADRGRTIRFGTTAGASLWDSTAGGGQFRSHPRDRQC